MNKLIGFLIQLESLFLGIILGYFIMLVFIRGEIGVILGLISILTLIIIRFERVKDGITKSI